jgi:hypothetical protein
MSRYYERFGFLSRNGFNSLSANGYVAGDRLRGRRGRLNCKQMLLDAASTQPNAPTRKNPVIVIPVPMAKPTFPG